MSNPSVVPGSQTPFPKMEARRILATWLGEHPGALAGALAGNGIPTPLPAGLKLPGFELEERSVLDLVVPDDSRAVTEGFIAALSRGVSVTRVRLASDPDQTVLVHYLDLREEFGILLRMMVSGASDTEAGPGLSSEDIVATRPRLGFMRKDELANIVSVDESASLMLGWSEKEMVGRRSLEFIHPDDHTRAIDNWMARRSSPSAGTRTVRLRHLRPDGSWLWVEISNEFVEDADSVSVHTQIIDISSEMAASEALRRSEALLRLVTDTVPVGLFHISCEGEVAFVNPVAQRLLGVTVPATRPELCKILAPGREDDLDEAITRVLEVGGEAHLDLEFEAPGGPRSACQVSLRTVMDQERTAGVRGCIVDVTELKQIADTDALTGLENRRSILQTLAQDLKTHHGRVAAIFLDLDEFKPVNDRFGHGFGDHTLTAVAERLRRALRPQDRIGRLGGDEFLVICPGVRLEKDALDIAWRIRGDLDEPLELDARALKITASIGVSLGARGVTVDELVATADVAMYQAKQDRGGPPVYLPIARTSAIAAS
jgi:diguanylate cyclase (GGDEF)-like protein/PAS domain S-box-containing protein